MCKTRALRIAPDRAAREAADTEATVRIRAVHAADGTYGVPRITAELRNQGDVVNHKKAARLMNAARDRRAAVALQALHHPRGPRPR